MDFAIRLQLLSLPAGLIDYILCPYRAVLDKLLLVGQHLCEGVHRRKSLMSSSLLLPQCTACLVSLIWMVLVMRGKCPYSFCFVGCCFQDLFNMAHSILMHFPSSLFSIFLVSIRVVHPYSKIDTTDAWKKLRFNLSDRIDFHMIDNLSIAVHSFASRILMSLSVDETLLPRYVNLSANFRESPSRMELSSFWLKRILFCLLLHRGNATCCLLQIMKQGFSLGRCICKKCYVICIVCVRNSFCEVSSVSCLF